jgi:hypothetical protein
VWAVAAYKEGWVCRSVWACGVGLVASGWARGRWSVCVGPRMGPWSGRIRERGEKGCCKVFLY